MAVTKLTRVCEAIIGQIESGAIREGDRLPSEEQLAAGFHVSVGTMQKALAQLAQSGLLTREQGRGTFVSGSRVNASEVTYLRFRDAAGNELPHYIHVKSVRRSNRAGPWAEFLGQAGPHIRIERNLSVGGRIDLYSEFWLGQADFARLNGIDKRSLEKNLRLLLGQKLSLPTLRIDQWIRFEKLSAAIARELRLDPDQPGFVMEMRGYTLRDQPLFYQRVCAAPFSENLIIVR